MRNYRIIFTLLCCLPFIGCGDGDDEPSRGPKPTLSMTIASSGANSVTLNMRRTNASSVKIIHKATGVITSETAQSVAQNGTQYTGTTVEIDGLTAQTTYTVFAVACNDSGEYSQMQHVRFTTDAPGPQMYPWEQSRSGILSYTDMVLCYGGSHHRTPYRWDKERFAPSVSYVDEQGKEHWLFDSFLFIEFQDSSRPDGGYYAYMVGLMKDYGFSAGKTQWKELIDYWFAGGSGMDALEGAVKDASARLGAPPSKRKVIMVLPDPIIYKVYDGKGNGKGDPGSTVYWGELNGRKMDFSTAEDRIAAYKWYVDEVRRRFDLGNYQYIDLAGFYIISEELVTPGDGWNHELKKSDEICTAPQKLDTFGVFFMKYNYEIRLKAVKLVLEGGLSVREAGCHLGCGRSQVHLWVTLFERHGLAGLKLRHGSYSAEFKLSVLKHMHQNHLSLLETAVHFGIPGPFVIRQWERLYQNQGAEGLRRKPQRRRPAMSKSKTKKVKLKTTPHEELLKELEYLRAENAYLKKLQALVEERIVRESGKEPKPSKD